MPRVHFPPAVIPQPPEPRVAAPIARRIRRKPPVKDMTKPAIRRLARRAGVMRISGVVSEDINSALKFFLTDVIHDAVAYTEYSRRKTVSVRDIIFALKRQNETLYGFGNVTDGDADQPLHGHNRSSSRYVPTTVPQNLRPRDRR